MDNYDDPLGNRMKLYESAEAGRRLMPLLPAFARLDGRSFHSLTAKLAKPFDPGFCALMRDVAMYLVRDTGAHVGYVQSDEITLCWDWRRFKSDIYFAGRIHKMVSTLAATASAYFNARWTNHMGGVGYRLATFDCRVWNVPNLAEAVNVFLWRELDATKNSVQMLARAHFSHRACHGKDCAALQEMLFAKGINWNDADPYHKRGTYYARRTVSRSFTSTELDALPPKHEARANPSLIVERTDVLELVLPPLTKIADPISALFGEPRPSPVAEPQR